MATLLPVLGLKMVLSLDLPKVLASKSTFRVQGGRRFLPASTQVRAEGAVVGIRWTWTEEAVGANQVWGARPSAEAVLRGHVGRRFCLRSCPVEGGRVETGGTPAMATLRPPQPPSRHPVLPSTLPAQSRAAKSSCERWKQGVDKPTVHMSLGNIL